MTNRKNVVLAWLLLVAISFCINSHAAKISDELKIKFDRLTNACFVPPKYAGIFWPKEISDHPTAQFANHKTISGISFNKISKFLYSTNDLTDVLAARSDQFVDIGSNTAPKIVANMDYNAITYNFSCTSVIKSIVDVGSEFPVKSLKLAFDAELRNDANTGLIVLYGRFQSPLAQSMNSSDVSVRIDARSALWLAMSSGATGNRYLDQLEGWLISSTNAKKASQVLNASADAGLSALVLNANWSGNAKVGYSSEFSSQEFDIYVVPRASDQLLSFTTQILPANEQVGVELGSALSVSPRLADVNLGQDTEVQVVIPGLRKELCIPPGEWSAVASKGSASGVRGVYDDKLARCTLEITWRPAEISFASEQLTFTLTNVRHLLRGKQVSFPVGLSYRQAAYPDVNGGLPEVNISNDGSSVKISVPLKWRLASGEKESAVSVLDSQLLCPAPIGNKRTSDFDYISSQNKVDSIYNTLGQNNLPKNVRCNLTLTVMFSSGGRQDLRRSFVVEVLFPSETSKSVAVN